tara:strand:+ start:2170 stop:2775 length:606 start_codon:yes stop_codon:yes gene_type:complete
MRDKTKPYLGHDSKLMAEQTKRLQANSVHIKELIDLTREFKTTKNIVEQPQILTPKPKMGILSRIKKYFRGVFYKYIIEPELKKIKIEKELTMNERTLKILEEGKKKIYDTQKYETEKYFERLSRARNENKTLSIRKTSPLFYEPDVVNTHNEDINRESKPSLIKVKEMEDAASKKVLNNQSNPKLLIKKAKLIRITSIEL